MRLLIIGGSDAGIGAALRARELDPRVDVAVLLADSFPNFSVCGLPFLVSGETPDWRDLAHRRDFGGIEILRNHTVETIDLNARRLRVHQESGASRSFPFDTLIVATGASPLDLPGTTQVPGVFPLHTMEHALGLKEFIETRNPEAAIIIGSGYLGLEMADALTHRNLRVTVVGRSPTPLPTVDAPISALVEEELKAAGVTVRNSTRIDQLSEADGMVRVQGSGFDDTAGVVIVAVGVRPNTQLAAGAGLATGAHGAVCVDRGMRTSAERVFAAGDCVETWHRLLEKNVYIPLGTTAHKQGRVAGENAVGGDASFAGSVGTQVVKVFNLAIARTGLLRAEALRAGLDAATTTSRFWDHKAYYPGAREITISVTGNPRTGKLLGAQLIGHHEAQIAKRCDVFAAAIHHGMAVRELNDLDLSYTPPFSSPWDPIQMAAQEWDRQHGRASD